MKNSKSAASSFSFFNIGIEKPGGPQLPGFSSFKEHIKLSALRLLIL